jgi:hypothetical protein
VEIALTRAASKASTWIPELPMTVDELFPS